MNNQNNYPNNSGFDDDYSSDGDDYQTYDNSTNYSSGNYAAPEQKTHDIEITTDGSGRTKKVKLDLEVDTTVKDLGPNPYVKIIHLARAVDAWRIFPRIFISVYIYLLYDVVTWYTYLTDPTMEQSGLISIIVGAGAAWFGLYVGSGKQK